MILTKTPFRISLAGGGSDLPAFYRQRAGAVLTSTVDKAMYIAIHPYFHDKIRIKYSRMEDVSSTSEIQHPLVRECLQQVSIKRGMEIASFADVPAGSGLGSSSAFTVGLLHALYAKSGIQPGARRLAEEACAIEIERVQEPIGKQDQYAVAFGGMNFIRFHPGGSVEIEPVNCSIQTRDALSQRLMLFYVGKERPAGSILAEQSRNMGDKDKFNQVIRMVELAEALRGVLERDDLDSLGDILNQGWQLKRGLASGITNSLIDTSYRRALEAGAEGGKLLGAGAGGFLLLSCRPEKQQQVREALAGLREMSVTLTAEGSQLLLDDGCNVPILATKGDPDAEPQPISCANDSSGGIDDSMG
jgi:D-glycero-alpha-D-manno-heptose-7-phosphate kinase